MVGILGGRPSSGGSVDARGAMLVYQRHRRAARYRHTVDWKRHMLGRKCRAPSVDPRQRCGGSVALQQDREIALPTECSAPTARQRTDDQIVRNPRLCRGPSCWPARPLDGWRSRQTPSTLRLCEMFCSASYDGSQRFDPRPSRFYEGADVVGRLAQDPRADGDLGRGFSRRNLSTCNILAGKGRGLPTPSELARRRPAPLEANARLPDNPPTSSFSPSSPCS